MPGDRGERHGPQAIGPRTGHVPTGREAADAGPPRDHGRADPLYSRRLQRGTIAYVSVTAEHDRKPSLDGARHTLAYGQYRLAYEVYGSGDRVLVWLHGLLLDANLSRDLARTLAAQGNRVVLLDLLGHGRSDKPRHAGPLRMDLYAEQVLCLLDELGVDQAVLGGVSLGTNVSLLTTVAAPGRVRGLVLEMPVLESAVPAAAGVFLPLLLGVHYARTAVRCVSRRPPACPATRFGPLDSFISAATSDPDEIAAVLHGSPARAHRPDLDQRRSITAPALVLGHGIDLIHSFTDAERLARQLPDARPDPDPHLRRAVGAPGPPDRRDQRVPRPRLGGHRPAAAARSSLLR